MNNLIKKIVKQLSSPFLCLPIYKDKLEQSLEVLISQLFPICKVSTEDSQETLLIQVYTIFLESLTSLLNKEKANQILKSFFLQLPNIRNKLLKDAETFFLSDPAAKSVEEIILIYPGFFALTVYRIAHVLHELNVPLIPRLFSEYAHSKVGIDIHPGAKIGANFFLDHGTGVVIGSTTIIGNNVKIYQGVTLGALYVTKELENVKRHPTIEDNVIIYSGATILGGETIIGHDSTIGGNVWITKSVAPYTLVYYSSEMKVKTIHNFKEPLNYVI